MCQEETAPAKDCSLLCMPEGFKLSDHRVGSLPDVFYVPDYISIEEEKSLLSNIEGTRSNWTQVSGRRLLNLGGHLHERHGVLLQVPLPSWLQAVAARLAHDTHAFGTEQLPNHVLVNAYLPGQGILPHQDGPLYYPGVCIISLGCPSVIRFTRKRLDGPAEGLKGPVQSVAVLPRSLLVFGGEAYEECLHGIDEVEEERLDDSIANLHMLPPWVQRSLPRQGQRTSLTVRRVLRVRKSLLRL